MFFLLADSGDAAALWAHRGLRERGLDPLEFVTPTMLAASPHWEHRVGVSGVDTSILFHRDRLLSSHGARAVLNRIGFLSADLFSRGKPDDRQYAQMELTALVMSCLHGLDCPVLNRPTAQGMAGSWRHPSEWAMLAGRAGLMTYPFRQKAGQDPVMTAAPPLLPRKTLFVAGAQVSGEAPKEVGEACLRLAALSRTALLGIEFVDGPGGPWTFADATPQPDFRLGGDPFLDTLAAVMKGDLQ